MACRVLGSLVLTNWPSKICIGINQIIYTQGSSQSPYRIQVLGILGPGFWHQVIYPQFGYYCVSALSLNLCLCHDMFGARALVLPWVLPTPTLKDQFLVRWLSFRRPYVFVSKIPGANI